MVVKMIGKVYAKEGMSREAFVNHWLTKHAPMVKQMFGDKLKKYIISIVASTDGEEPGYQGKAELWFDNMADVQAGMSSPTAKETIADQANWARKITMVIVEEHTIV
jgi:uncharacterized protein (TIGR02118 family)